MYLKDKMNKILLISILLFSSIFIYGCNLFNSPTMINQIEVEAKFVTGVEIATLDKLIDSKIENQYTHEEGDIYFVARCAPKGNPGKRILNLKVEFVEPKFLQGKKIELIPFGTGFLTKGAAYSVTKVISVDQILPKETRNIILQSKPIFNVIELSAK